MGQHFVRIVEDGTLGTDEGWAFGTCDDARQLYLIAERSAMTDQAKVDEMWSVARSLVLEQAVNEGLVVWAKPEPDHEATSDLRAAVMAGHGGEGQR